jgi:aminoglycoside 6'-N-acetyltransferase I
MKNDKDMIKRAGMEDAEALADLAMQMWPDHAPEDLEAEFRRLAMNDEAACFIKYVDEKPIAFAQCGLRHDYVEGTDSFGFHISLGFEEANRIICFRKKLQIAEPQI